jgi:hypothetical protein
MTTISARQKLRENLGPIHEDALREFDDVPDVQDAIRLLAATRGASEHLLTALVEAAGLSLFDPLEHVFLDEEPTE